jgi:hypothetical protein
MSSAMNLPVSMTDCRDISFPRTLPMELMFQERSKPDLVARNSGADGVAGMSH